MIAEAPRRSRRDKIIAGLVLALLVEMALAVLGGRWLYQHITASSTTPADQKAGATASKGEPAVEQPVAPPAQLANSQVCTPARGPAGEYALVEFNSLPQYSYASLVGDGNWDLLDTQPMVHWHAGPAPGQQGNMLLALHREPNFEHIDELNVGGIITVVDHACHSYQYQVSQRWNLSPDQSSVLGQTSGHDLTLITCTPFWRDTNRLVWRASLVAVDGAHVSGGPSGPAPAPSGTGPRVDGLASG